MRQTAAVCRASEAGPALLTALAVFLAVLFTLMAPYSSARAQDGIMANGDLAVTGFSGTKDVGGQTFIDTDGHSLQVFDVSGKGAANAQVVDAPVKYSAHARDIGQVFGVALDNAPNPNIYVGASIAHGVKIVIPDNNGDGMPERVNTGQAGAMFMEGQFGAALGGGPGTVWRIDGTTGDITKFADITFGGIANSGPGLGNIAFDPAHFQFYVSDLDTGAIHRLDLSGNELGIFDHGVDGLTAAGLPAVPMNAGDRMDITSLAFDSTNSDTWGLADVKRRVWGLAYYDGRLYYAVADGPQVWSVGINSDGSFAADARVEINTVPGGMPVSDILFTPNGRMVLAQRGGHLSAPDYTLYHQPKQNRVLRYARNIDGTWIQDPDEYAIGFPVDHKNAAGGIGLACDGTLWSTGDALRNDPALSASLLPGGPLVVHGLQGNSIDLVRPFNVPPWASWFVDYQGQPASEADAGHVGDVEVYRNCPGGYTESFPGWYPIPEWVPHDDWVPPVWWPREPDLDIEKYANECRYFGGVWYICDYTIVVTNVGAADYIGHLHVTDNPPAGAIYIAPPGGSIPWNCAQPGGAGANILCDSVNVEHLHPGESETLDITIAVPVAHHDEYIENCAIVDDPFDFWPNEDCDRTEIPRPDLEIEKTFYHCEPEGHMQRCYFVISIENVGGAPYTGPLQFEENVPAGTIFGGIFGSTTAGWGCIGGAPIKCTLPDPPGVTMNPGDVELVGISVLVPFNGGQTDYENCVDLGSDVHPDDPAAPGANHWCEPFTVAWPVLECPAGWTEVPPGGAPADHQVIAVDGLFNSIMCMRPNPEEAAPAPIKHECPAGWTEVPEGGAPQGMLVIAVDGVNPDGTKWGLMCMKPKPEAPKEPEDQDRPDDVTPSCRTGEKVFQSAGQVPQSWTWRKVTAGRHTIYCAKPPVLLPQPECRTGEKTLSSLRQLPKGWTYRTVTLGQRTIFCATPPVRLPEPECRSGEKAFQSSRLVPQGWTSRKVTLGNSTIYCAKPGQTPTPQTPDPIKPRCIGGKLVMLKSLPPQYRCLCPDNKRLVQGRCVSKPVACPQGWSKVRGKCLPPQSSTPTPTPSEPEAKACPKGWKRVNGKCIPPKIVTCPKGWKKVRGKCIPPQAPPQSTPRVTPQASPQTPKKPILRIKPQTRVTPKLNFGAIKKGNNKLF